MSVKKDILVLGCGDVKIEGAVHVDIRKLVAPDMVWDLNQRPWPFKNEVFREVVAEDIIEHLDEIVPTIEEIHRVMAQGATLWITTPHWRHPNSWTDPTHKWHLTERSFDYFDPDTPFGSKYWYYSGAKFRIVERGVRGGNIELRMVKR